MIVVDASVLGNMLVYAGSVGRAARSALKEDPAWVAPEHCKAEVFSLIRGLLLGQKIEERVALHAVERLQRLGIETVALDGLLPRMWERRANVSGYDAAYVALAASRELTLVTSDARLKRGASANCSVRLVSSTPEKV